MNIEIQAWVPDQRRCMVTRASGGEEHSPPWRLTVCPTQGGKFIACVERSQPDVFLMQGPFETRTGAKRWAVDQAKELIATVDPDPDETVASLPGDEGWESSL